MKALKMLGTAGALGFALVALNLHAADRTGDGKTVTPPRPAGDGKGGQIIPQPPRPDGTGVRPGDGTGTRPEPPRPPRPDLPADVKALIDKFEATRQQYLDQEKELTKQIRDATAEQRDKIREQQKAVRDAWLEQTKELRKEIAQRIEELRGKLKDQRPVIDQAKEKIGDGTGKKGKGDRGN